MIRWIGRLKLLNPRHTVLDVGCGAGWFASRASEGGFRSFGVDVNPLLVALAKESANSRKLDVGLVAACAESLPYRQCSFDICVCLSSLGHVDDSRRTLREAERVVKPGGVLAITTIGRMCPITGELGIPVFGWFPRSLRDRILAWRQEYCPAKHWFCYAELSEELKMLGLKSHDILELVSAADLTGAKTMARPVLPLIRRSKIFRYTTHFLMPALIVIAVKPEVSATQE